MKQECAVHCGCSYCTCFECGVISFLFLLCAFKCCECKQISGIRISNICGQNHTECVCVCVCMCAHARHLKGKNFKDVWAESGRWCVGAYVHHLKGENFKYMWAEGQMVCVCVCMCVGVDTLLQLNM